MKPLLLCLMVILIFSASGCDAGSAGGERHLSNRCLVQRVTQAVFAYKPRSTTGWKLVRQARDIPFKQLWILETLEIVEPSNPLNNDGKDPQDFQDTIQPPHVMREDGLDVVTFFAWTEQDGILGSFEAQVEGETLKFIHGEVVDYYIGSFYWMGHEALFQPRKGITIANENVGKTMPGNCR